MRSNTQENNAKQCNDQSKQLQEQVEIVDPKKEDSNTLLTTTTVSKGSSNTELKEEKNISSISKKPRKIVFPTKESFELTEELITSIFNNRRRSPWSFEKIKLEYFNKLFYDYKLSQDIIKISSINDMIEEIELGEWRWNNDRCKVHPRYDHDDIHNIKELIEGLPTQENLLRQEKAKVLLDQIKSDEYRNELNAKLKKIVKEISSNSIFSSSKDTSPEKVLYDLCWDDYNEKAMNKLLSNKSININKQFTLGDTCLMRAARKGYTNKVSILLENGADRDLVDNLGNTAAYYASSKEIKELIDNYSNVKSQSLKK